MRLENHIKLTQSPTGYTKSDRLHKVRQVTQSLTGHTKPGDEEKIDQRLYAIACLTRFTASWNAASLGRIPFVFAVSST